MATYTVQRGDTLSQIAAKYGTTTQALYNQNRSVIGSNPNLIITGQKLNIGAVTPQAQATQTAQPKATTSTGTGRNINMQAEGNKYVSQAQNTMKQMQAQRENIYQDNINKYNQSIDLGRDREIARLEHEQQQGEQGVEDQSRSNYVNYRKQIDRYGADAEGLQELGLRGSGFAETTRARVFNQYQKGVTDMYNKLQEINADFNLKIGDAYAKADINKANMIIQENARRMEDIKFDYQMNDNLQKIRLQMTESHRNYEYQKWEAQRNYDLKQQELKWEKEYKQQQLSLQRQIAEWDRQYKDKSLARASSSSSSGSGTSSLLNKLTDGVGGNTGTKGNTLSVNDVYIPSSGVPPGAIDKIVDLGDGRAMVTYISKKDSGGKIQSSLQAIVVRKR